MTRPLAIEVARENARFALERALATSTRAGHRDPALLPAVADAHHTLGLVALLADVDPETFGRRLAMAGQADRRCRGMDLSPWPTLLMANRWLPFADVLASGDLAGARGLAQVLPTAHQDGFEYQDDFLRIHFMQRLLLSGEDRPALLALLDRWTQAAEGEPGPYHGLSQALLDRDAAAFEVALAAVLADRRTKRAAWRKSPHHRIELDATEGCVFVLGLAYLRLAELRGIPTAAEYEDMPAPARIRAGVVGLAPDAWLTGP